jgi:hypothetical protein
MEAPSSNKPPQAPEEILGNMLTVHVPPLAHASNYGANSREKQARLVGPMMLLKVKAGVQYRSGRGLSWQWDSPFPPARTAANELRPLTKMKEAKYGAGWRIRTPDLLITNQPLYLLS